MTNDRNNKEILNMLTEYLGYRPIDLGAPLPTFSRTPSHQALYHLVREALGEHKGSFFISRPMLEDGALWVELYQCRGVPPLSPQKLEALRASLQPKLPKELTVLFRCVDIFSAEVLGSIRDYIQDLEQENKYEARLFSVRGYEEVPQ